MAKRGRPSLGITKKVSLTLTEEEWAEIEASGQTVAAFLKEYIQKPSVAEAAPHRDEQKQEIEVAFLQERIREWEDRYAHLAEEIGALQVELKREQNKSNLNSNMTRAGMEERWEIHLRNLDEVPPADIIEAAKASMYSNLFPKNAVNAVVRTHQQYECPFTGKRFGSMDKLVRAAIPRLIERKISEKERKAELTTIREREKAPKYLMDIR